MTGRRPCIAIDGPVGAGKSTIARLVADRLGYTYIDSGAMYRALAWAAREEEITREDAADATLRSAYSAEVASPTKAGSEEATSLRSARAVALANTLDILLFPQPGGGNRVMVEGADVTEQIRTQEIGQLASRLSEIAAVRERMVAMQQEMARAGGVVMEGRDIQTVVLPEAEVKIFLTASAEERAKRRHRELLERGVGAQYEEVLAEIRQRDERDSNREHSPLKPAPDATWVDTDGLSIEEVAERVLEVVRRRGRFDASPLGDARGRQSRPSPRSE